MSYINTLKNMVQSAQDETFATEALSDYLTSQYEQVVSFSADIVTNTLPTLSAEDFSTAKQQMITKYGDSIVLTDDDGNITSINLSDYLDAVYNSSDVTFTIGGNEYDTEEVIEKLLDQGKAAKAQSILIKNLLNDNLQTVAEKGANFYNQIQLEFGGMSANLAGYVTSLYNTITTNGTNPYDIALAVKNWLLRDTEPVDLTAPDFNGASTSGVSAWGAMVQNVQDFGQGLLNGLKKAWKAVDGFFGGIISKAARGLVQSVQTITGIRDAFSVNENASSLYFTDYGRNFKILKTSVTQILGSAEWLEHVNNYRYYQIQLPAGLLTIYLYDNDSNYVYASLYTRPINEATFACFFNPSIARANITKANYPEFTNTEKTTALYVDQYSIRWYNPKLISDANSLALSIPNCIGYYAVPANNTLTVNDWIDRFSTVTKSTISGWADWFANDESMWVGLRNGNTINMMYLKLMYKINLEECQGDEVVTWYDPGYTMPFSYLQWLLMDADYYDYNSFNSDGSNYHIRNFPLTDGELADVRNSDLALLLTGTKSPLVHETVAITIGSIKRPDYLICPSLYLIFGQNEFAAYVNKEQLPISRYQIQSDSELARTLGTSIFAVAAIATVAIGIVVAVKLRKASRTIKATIAAKERQLTTQLAVLANGWTAENWAITSTAYNQVNKLNKWAALANTISNGIYGALTAIPSYIAGKLSSAVSTIKSDITSLITGGKDLSNVTDPSNPAYLAKIYHAITGQE